MDPFGLLLLIVALAVDWDTFSASLRFPFFLCNSGVEWKVSAFCVMLITLIIAKL